MIDAIVAWDAEDDPDGNVQHIIEHGITMEEVEEVLLNENNPVGESRSSGRPLTFGKTSTGNTLRWYGNRPWTIPWSFGRSLLTKPLREGKSS